MGRGRGKGRKLSNNDDLGSGEEKVHAQKRRGRPQKPVKDENEEDEPKKTGEEKKSKAGDMNQDVNTTGGPAASENAEKRSGMERVETEKSAQKMKTNDSAIGSSKSNGFRHHGSRRKSTPRRAAEVGVECG